ncbi:unknown [Streptomyces phage mu1/6]|uniref:excisionase and transcriptional regulator n=1 Tax=Streptomyces phage mu1/6 TaxID=370623 RepID=UPI0000D4F6B7|nr:excisionase and transcriptional regulator [Streptomyces phage mu1/6]ABD94174.1 unknown [Streptomyces phage mu1/6]
MSTITALPAPLLQQQQVQAHYGVSDWTVNQWVRKGCPVVRLPNGHRRFDLAEVKAWMAEQSATGREQRRRQSEHALSQRSA